MKTPDERIIFLIDLLKSQKVIKNRTQFHDEVGVIRQTVYKIGNGEASFTVSHIKKICKKYNVNANWIFGIDKKVFRTEESIEVP